MPAVNSFPIRSDDDELTHEFQETGSRFCAAEFDGEVDSMVDQESVQEADKQAKC
jgi:hypothetical protein